MLLGVLPGNADISAVLSDIASQLSVLRLQKFYFGCFKEHHTCHFTLALILGDSPASNSVIGLRSPSCAAPCRLCLVSSANLNSIPVIDLTTQSIDNANWQHRNIQDYTALLIDVQSKHKRGVMEVQEQRLKECGIMFYAVWMIKGTIHH